MIVILSLIALIVLSVLAILLFFAIRTRSMARDAERAVPMAGKLQPVPGGAIHYVDMGPRDAQPLVLIHGLSAQLQHFTYAMAGLLADDFRVIALDRPGCGYSERASDDLADLPDQARMIQAFLESLGIEKPILVGHSLGGAVSLEMAMDQPGKVAALALICPATDYEPTPSEAFGGLEVHNRFMRRLIGHTIAAPLARKTAEKVLTDVFQPDICPADFVVRAGAALGLRPKGFITASADYVMTRHALRRLAARYAAELKVPGGVLFATDDAVVSPDRHGRPMQAFGLEYRELSGHGHMIPITAPQDCADFVRRIAASVA